MSRYDLSINMNNRNSSQTLVLEQIEPDSFILEFGCATGYMTKYMNEKLGCLVDAIEIDSKALGQAAKYTHDAFCGDIDRGDWFDYFSIKENKYDYILFADVLEHLEDPLTTLNMAKDLLCRHGQIIISIPNVCHNDIIVQLFDDHFRYTDLGLLDKTHLHFWGRKDFDSFVDNAGLKITETRTVVFPTQGTEQRTDYRPNNELMSLLNRRPYGEVYQWIFTCEKK